MPSYNLKQRIKIVEKKYHLLSLQWLELRSTQTNMSKIEVVKQILLARPFVNNFF